LAQQGLSISEIARRTGYDRKTVRKQLIEGGPPRYGPRPPRPTKLAPYTAYVQQRLQEGVFNCATLLRELRQRGYAGGMTRLRLFVHPLRIQPREVATCRFETAPGEQAQVDWASFGRFQGHRLSAFVMTVGYSRMKYVEFTLSQDLEMFLTCHLHAFAAFGGLPQTLLYDNLKSVVLAREAAGVRFHPRFLDFAAVFGVIPRLCQPGRPQTKGKVENVVGYVKGSFWPGRRFTDLADLNGQAREWCATVANALPHATTRAIPAERLRAEGLQPLEGKTYDTSYTVHRLVSKDCLISYRGSRYSVPWAYARKPVVVKVPVGGQTLTVVAHDQAIATHALSLTKGALMIEPAHYAGLPHAQRPWRITRPPVLPGLPLPPGPGLGVMPTAPAVEIRSLSVYDTYAEDDCHVSVAD
jgi:transposase